jgi:hypothetical protein
MSNERRLALGFAIGRIAYAAALIVAPRNAGGPWLGEAVERGGGRVAARALAARDGLISAGLGFAAWRGEPMRPWLAALVASDLADIGSTLADREHLPRQSAPGTVTVAGAAAIAGAALHRAADE